MQIIRNGRLISNASGVGGVGADVRYYQGPFDLDRTYQKWDSVEIAYGFAVSRTDNNLGNDPLLDNERNWILLLNGNRKTEWYCRNQTEELPTGEIGENQTVSTEGVIGFSGTAGGDESENGGVPGIVLSDISAVAHADPSVSLAYSGISLQSARYDILAEFYGNQTPDADLHIRMMQVMENADDIEELVGTQRQQNFIATGNNQVHAHYGMFRRIRLAVQTTFYFQLVNYGTNKNRIVGYVQIERTA